MDEDFGTTRDPHPELERAEGVGGAIRERRGEVIRE